MPIKPQRLPSGSIRIRIGAGTDASGKYQVLSKTLPPHATPQDIALAELELRAQCGKLTADAVATSLGAAVASHMERQRTEWAPKTFGEYRATLKRYFVATPLAAIPLSQLRGIHIDQHYRTIEPPTEIRRLHSVISGTLRWCVAVDLIPTNPAINVTAIPKAKRSTVTATQPRNYRRALESTTNLPLRCLVRFLGSTGVRLSEALALRWEDLELTAGNVTADISGALTVDAGVVVRKTTKTHAERTVKGPAQLSNELQQIRTQQRETAIGITGVTWDTTSWVWSQRGAGIMPWRPDTGSKRVASTGVKAGELRHMVATQLIGAGMGAPDVAAILGHASAKMTLDVYSQPLEGHLDRAVEILNKL